MITKDVGNNRWPGWLERASKLPAFLVLAWIAGLYLYADLGRYTLDDVDGLYTHVARQMIERRDWVTPYADGVRFLDKPPLMFWLMAISYRALGLTEFAPRVPFVLAVVCTAWLLGLTLKRAGESYGASLAALCFSICGGTFVFTRTTQPDMLMVLFDTLALLTFTEWYRDEKGSLAKALGFYAALAGAALSKGLVGLILPLGMVGGFFVWNRRLPRLRHFHWVKGLLLFLTIAAPWFVLAARRNPGFVWHFFVDEHVLRFLGRRQPFDYQSIPLPLFWLLFLVWLFPWSPFIPAIGALFKSSVPEPLRDVVRLSLSWALFGLVFFSLSARLEHYALALLPPISILIGVALARGVRQDGAGEEAWVARGLRVLALVGALLGPLLIGVAIWLAVGHLGSLPALDRGLDAYKYDFGPLFHIPPPVVARLLPMLFASGIVLSASGPAIHWLSQSRRPLAILALALVGTILCILAAKSLAACEEMLSSRQFGIVLGRLQKPGDVVINMGDFETANSLSVYAPMPLLVFEGKAAVLSWGLRYADAPQRVLTRDEFVARWNTPQRTFLLLPLEQFPQLPHGAYHEVFRDGGRVLYCNQVLTRSISVGPY